MATVYTTLGIRARPTRPTRPDGTHGLVPRPTQAWLFVRPVGSTGRLTERRAGVFKISFRRLYAASCHSVTSKRDGYLYFVFQRNQEIAPPRIASSILQLDRIMARGARAAIYTYLATVYTTRPAQARLFVRPVRSTERCMPMRCTSVQSLAKSASALSTLQNFFQPLAKCKANPNTFTYLNSGISRLRVVIVFTVDYQYSLHCICIHVPLLTKEHYYSGSGGRFGQTKTRSHQQKWQFICLVRYIGICHF